MDEEFQRQIAVADAYVGPTVCILREEQRYEPGNREERLVAQLFHCCREEASGCLTIDGQPIWLMGSQWPNQGKQRGRRADLVGLRADGGLVVFECKQVTGEPPLTALVEGLDYLACLLRTSNFRQIVEFVPKLRGIRGEPNLPEPFRAIKASPIARPSLVILAPRAYFYGRNLRSVRAKEWTELVAAGEFFIPSIRTHFAVTDFNSTSATLFQGEFQPIVIDSPSLNRQTFFISRANSSGSNV